MKTNIKIDIWISIFLTSPRKHAVGIRDRQCPPPKPKIICPPIFDLDVCWGGMEIIKIYTTHFLFSIMKTYRHAYCIFILGCLHKYIKWPIIVFVLFVCCCCCCCCCCCVSEGLFVVVVVVVVVFLGVGLLLLLLFVGGLLGFQ